MSMGNHGNHLGADEVAKLASIFGGKDASQIEGLVSALRGASQVMDDGKLQGEAHSQAMNFNAIQHGGGRDFS